MYPPEWFQNLCITVMVVIVIFLLSLIPWGLGHWHGYRDGQIDAINGKIYWQLIPQNDGTKIWVECPQECEGR
jgi:hypothetical protein